MLKVHRELLWATSQSLLLLGNAESNQKGKLHDVPPWFLAESYFRNNTELCLDSLRKQISQILSGFLLRMWQMWACILLNAFSICLLGTWMCSTPLQDSGLVQLLLVSR